jgi:ribosomal 50S subunit-recycling heat shock protein
MRIDKYLQVSRIIKRRAVAKEATEGGRVAVNGRVVKASYEVKIGDQITVRFGDQTITVEVVDIRDHVPAKDAASLYRTV